MNCFDIFDCRLFISCLWFVGIQNTVAFYKLIFNKFKVMNKVFVLVLLLLFSIVYAYNFEPKTVSQVTKGSYALS